MPRGFEIFDLQVQNIDEDDISEPEFHVVENIPEPLLKQAKFSEFRWRGKVVEPRRKREVKVLKPSVARMSAAWPKFVEREQVSFVYSYPTKVTSTNSRSEFSPTVCVSLMKGSRKRS